MWFLQPWTLESKDPKHWSFEAPVKAVPGEDGDGEAIRDCILEAVEGDCADDDIGNHDLDSSAMDPFVEDGGIVRVLEEECKDAISQMLDSTEPSQPLPTTCHIPGQKIEPMVEYMGKAIYKSTLVADLNGNPFLLKDLLTRIKNSVYFNNAEDYLSAANSTTTALLGLGSDCGVLFMQSQSLGKSSGVTTTQKRNRNGATVGRLAVGVDVGI